MKRTLLIIGLLMPLTACTAWFGDSNDTANEGAASSKSSTYSSDESGDSSLSDEEKKSVSTLISSRINTYVSMPPELGGQYYVTDIQWDSGNTAIVTYEDGHTQGKARVTATVRNGNVEIVHFAEFSSE